MTDTTTPRCPCCAELQAHIPGPPGWTWAARLTAWEEYLRAREDARRATAGSPERLEAVGRASDIGRLWGFGSPDDDGETERLYLHKQIEELQRALAERAEAMTIRATPAQLRRLEALGWTPGEMDPLVWALAALTKEAP